LLPSRSLYRYRTSLAANLQLSLQKLLLRRLATSSDRDFSQEDQKDRRREMGVRAAAGGQVGVARRMRGERSNLLIFCPRKKREPLLPLH
jgi:hypothetical protein